MSQSFSPNGMRQVLLNLLEAGWNPPGGPLRAPVPWIELVELAGQAQLSPLLYHAISRAGATPPAEVTARLKDAYRESAITNTARFHDLARLLSLLASVKVPVIVLKGAALAQEVYGDPALRPMHDFDLLIRKEHLSRVHSLLEGEGFTAESSAGSQISKRNEWGFARLQPYPLKIDLHWHPLSIYFYMQTLPAEWFWQHSHALEIGGQPTLALDPGANLLYLATHLAFNHRFLGDRWYVDLAWLVHTRHEQIDWEACIDAAQNYQLLLVLRETLERLSACWPALPLDLPRQRLASLQASSQEQRIYRLSTMEPRSSLVDVYTDMVCLPNLAAKLKLGVVSIFPSPAYMRYRYGITHAWQLPYMYARRIVVNLLRMARLLPHLLRRTHLQ